MRYVALLRGINVSGHKPVKMDQLRALLTKIGFTNVTTYIQSGNVIFDSSSSSPRALTAKVKSAIQDEFGFLVPVLVLPASDLNEAVRGNPFTKGKGIDPAKLHVTFLAEPPSKAGLEKLGAIKAGKDEYRCLGNLVYLHCPGGYGITKLSNTAIEKALGIEATTRNWKTVQKLCRLAIDG